MNEWIKGFWNTDEGLKWLYWGLIVLIPLLTAALGIFSYVVAGRRDFLKEEAARLEWETERTQLEKQSKELKEQVEEATSELGGLEDQLAASQERVQKLEEKDEPREITPKQQQRLVAVLSPFAGQEVEILALSGDQEAYQFAMQIASVLKEAGWNPHVGSGVYGGPPPTGVVVVVQVPATPPPAAVVLLQSFQGAGISVSVERSPQMPASRIQMHVGQKP